MQPVVYILILNWNGWGDTLECLESVFRLDYPNFRVIVCDNASSDESLSHIKAWAEGRLDVAKERGGLLRDLSYPPVAKPIPYVEYDRATAEAGGRTADGDARLVLIRTGANLGYGAGNNVGLRYALARGDFQYVWLLNNDTVVKAGALGAMVEQCRRVPAAGMCGSVIYLFDEPDKISCVGGGSLQGWLKATRSLTDFAAANESFASADGSRAPVYVTGASLLVRSDVLRDIGLVPGGYFLYFEDTEWAILALRKGYALTYAPDSVVYHRVSASSGGGGTPLLDYYYARNRLLFAARMFPLTLPAVAAVLARNILVRLVRGEWRRLGMAVRMMLGRHSGNARS
ncbi:MAG: glycosyltransferase family 2 protein [Alphaproteobacteria bacterium]